jgi:hypothetical protein
MSWSSLPNVGAGHIYKTMTYLFKRKVTVLLLSLAMLLGTVPMATAADHPTSAMASMAMEDVAMQSCDQHIPMPNHRAPCGDMQTCLGMLGCAAPVIPPQFVAASINFQFVRVFWGPERVPNGISPQPAHRPPIA